MEDIVGEYILNISKDNLKIAALRGKVKLENVQLDGDLIGSHVLGAVGLSGFGVLSCWAKSLKISVPLKNLEKQPTRFEIQGIHLLCVPLLPSTAHRTYGAGTVVDPQCSLRTRAKRSSLARLERNFFQGRIPGEGPPTRRVRNAFKRAASNLRKSKAKWKSKRFNCDNTNDNDSFSEKGDSSLSDLSNEVPDSLFMPSNNSWAVKLREKVLRNLEISISNMHVRCEISQGGLDFIHPGQIHFQQGSGVHEHLTPEQRAFAFGLTLDSFIIRTPTQEDTCRNASTEISDENSTVTSNPKSKANISPTTSGEIKYKQAEISNLSFYWDDDPPLILSDSHLLVTTEQNLSPTRVLTRLAAAMEVMADFQDPGDLILLSLCKPEVSSPTRKTTNKHKDPSKPHTYCFENFCAQMKMELGDRNQSGPMKLLAEFLPVKFPLQFRSYQFIQYQKLKSAMYSQQRFDTMLRQRPNGDPISQPRQWWKYLIACVTTSPHSRPWEDVAKITKCRARYVELVKKKITSSSEGSGFHSGLKDEESFELLSLEDLLPIEALQTFHLIALREVYEDTKRVEKVSLEEMGSDEVEFAVKSSGRPRLLNPFRRTKKSVDQGKDADDEVFPKKSSIGGLDSSAVVAAINSRMGRKSWINTFILNEVNISLVLIQGNERLIQVELQATGEVKTLGPGRFDLLFDIIRFEIIDPQKRLVHFIQYQTIDCGKLLMFEAHRDMFQGDLSLSVDSPLSLGQDQAMELPPIGVVCRLSANKETNSLKLGISALPATLVWSKPCMDAVLEFFSSPSTELQTEVSRQLRNVATPLARKAILALMSPNEFQINMNVAAPKVWFPISLEADDGAVHFDAGKFIMSISKKELLTDTFWNFCARDIQVMFVRQKESISDTSRKECITIVKPLQMQVEAIMAEHKIEKPAKNPAFYALNPTPDEGPWRKLDIFVSSICLNLVDAEILARAIGKWYASGLVKVRKLKEKKSFASFEKGLAKKQGEEAILQGSKFTSTGVSFLSVHIERIQMALEGHSKSKVHVANGKESHVGSNGCEPRTRTYVVDLVDISIGRLSQKSISKSQFLISDIGIFRADCDTRLDYKMVPTYNAHTIPHCILIRLDKEESSSREASNAAAALHLSPPRLNAKQSPSPKSPSGPIEIGGLQKGNVTSFLSVRLFHDRLLHLDEVEIGMNSVVLRITPTTLKDCSKGFRKVMELIQIVTQEMERYVHEGGRKARQAKLGK
jgi:Vacuolar sorting-associated protein 13, N-terminal/N-terminal region of Chorein or VPS13